MKLLLILILVPINILSQTLINENDVAAFSTANEGDYYIDENGYKDGPHTLEELCKEGEFDEKGVGSTKKRRFLQP